MRPLAMTVAVVIAGLLPIMFGSGTGSEVMRRTAAPMVGGMITAPLLTMFVVAGGLSVDSRTTTCAPDEFDPAIGAGSGT